MMFSNGKNVKKKLHVKKKYFIKKKTFRLYNIRPISRKRKDPYYKFERYDIES